MNLKSKATMSDGDKDSSAKLSVRRMANLDIFPPPPLSSQTDVTNVYPSDDGSEPSKLQRSLSKNSSTSNFDKSMIDMGGDDCDVTNAGVSVIAEDDACKRESNGKTDILSGGLKPCFICKAFRFTILLTLFFILLGNIDPACPLLTPYQQPSTGTVCYMSDTKNYLSSECTVATTKLINITIERCKLGLATFSFAAATSIRTISAPLYRLDNKIKSSQYNIHLIQQMIHLCNQFAGKLEQYSYDAWENAAKSHNVLKYSSLSSLQSPMHNPPEIDLGLLVPCDASEARVYLLQNEKDATQEATSGLCQLRDVISNELLMEYAAINFDSDFSLATHPLVLRNLWPPESFDGADTNRRLTPTGVISDPQLSSFILPNYFADATKTGYSALVPNSRQISLSQFVKNIMTGITPYGKIGTQSIIEAFPDLKEEIVQPKLAKELFGWNPWLDEFKERASKLAWGIFGRMLHVLPPSTYYPIFIAGIAQNKTDEHSRTDLHTEPIGNIAVQLHGQRQWTLIPAKWSGLLRPTVSKHGRGM